MKGRHGGFTLLELIVVLAIGGILLTLVPMALSRANESAELRATTRRLVAGLKLARNQAITTHQPTVLWLDLAEKWMRVEQRQHPIPPHIQIDLRTARQDLDGDRAGFRFFPDGTATGGYVILQSGQLRYRIDIDWVTGKIQIADEYSP